MSNVVLLIKFVLFLAENFKFVLFQPENFPLVSTKLSIKRCFLQAVQLLSENAAFALIVSSLISNTSIADFYGGDVLCVVFRYITAVGLWQKACGGFVMAAVRYLYMEKQQFFMKFGNNGVLFIALTIQMLFLSIGLARVTLIDLTMGARLKDSFSYGVSRETDGVENRIGGAARIFRIRYLGP